MQEKQALIHISHYKKEMALTWTLSSPRENHRPLLSARGGDKSHRRFFSSDSDGDISIRLALSSVRGDVFNVIDGDRGRADRIWIDGRTPFRGSVRTAVGVPGGGRTAGGGDSS